MWMSASIASWRHSDATICVVVKKDAGGAQLAYKINPIEFYKEWWNRNTVKISFCKVAVPLVRFSIKDVKMTKKKKKKKKNGYPIHI